MVRAGLLDRDYPRGWFVRLLIIAVTAALVLFFLGGKPNGSWLNGAVLAQPIPDEAPSFAAVQGVFDQHCIRCHSGDTAPRGQDLSEGESFANIVRVSSVELPEMNRIEPGQPERSYLFLKISDRHLEHGGRGRQMPLGRPSLTTEELHLIRDWITAGAVQ